MGSRVNKLPDFTQLPVLQSRAGITDESVKIPIMALLAAVHFQDGDLSGHKSVLTYLTPGHRPAQGLVL